MLVGTKKDALLGQRSALAVNAAGAVQVSSLHGVPRWRKLLHCVHHKGAVIRVMLPQIGPVPAPSSLVPVMEESGEEA
jgi:hypothetical protein